MIDDLIRKLEAAPKGNAALGAEMLAHVRNVRLLSFEQYSSEIWIAVEASDGERYEVKHLHNPTTSLDAALTLLPTGKWWLIGPGRTRGDEPLYGAAIYEPVVGEPNLIAEGEHETSAAIALCIACLRAREALS